MPIKDFEADDLMAGTMKENSRLRQENESLRKVCRQLTEKAEGRDGPNPEMVKALSAKPSAASKREAKWWSVSGLSSRSWNETVSIPIRRVGCFTNY